MVIRKENKVDCFCYEYVSYVHLSTQLAVISQVYVFMYLVLCTYICSHDMIASKNYGDNTFSKHRKTKKKPHFPKVCLKHHHHHHHSSFIINKVELLFYWDWVSVFKLTYFFSFPFCNIHSYVNKKKNKKPDRRRIKNFFFFLILAATTERREEK